MCPVVSSALLMELMCASLAEMGMEIKRAKVEWPCISARLEYLPGDSEKHDSSIAPGWASG